MSTKAKKAAPAPKKAAKATPAAASKADKKGKAAKGGESEHLTEAQAQALAAAQPDEDAEEEEAASAGGGGGGGGNAAALAAATSGSEMSASFKNFRHHPDMENFYRFIYENDLRHEALAIIDQIMIEKAARKVTKSAKTASH